MVSGLIPSGLLLFVDFSPEVDVLLAVSVAGVTVLYGSMLESVLLTRLTLLLHCVWVRPLASMCTHLADFIGFFSWLLFLAAPSFALVATSVAVTDESFNHLTPCLPFFL
jgi:hypothetical protein